MKKQAMAKKEAADEAQLQVALEAGDTAAFDYFVGQRDRSSRGAQASGPASNHSRSHGQQRSSSHG